MSALHISNENFEQEVLNAELPVLVDFWAPWCGPCKMIGPFIDEVAAQSQGKAKVCKVNIDECESIAQEYKVLSIPTLILFKDGQEVQRQVGARPKAEIEKMIS